MADGRMADDMMTKVSEVRELYRGRFTEEDVEHLLVLNNGDVRETVNFILQNEAEEVSRVIREEQESWTAVDHRAVDQRVKHVKTDKPTLARARSGFINTDSRQFACAACDNVWWKRVPSRKMVSECDRCGQRYDPVPRDKEWGWAEFRCECGRVFRGFCQAGVPSPCYKCHQLVYPGNIQRPQPQSANRRRSQGHSCAGCSGGVIGGAPGGPGGETVLCVHPRTRRTLNLKLVVYASQPHQSSGSTVATFLDQENLLQEIEEFFLPPIPEDGEEESSNDEEN